MDILFRTSYQNDDKVLYVAAYQEIAYQQVTVALCKDLVSKFNNKDKDITFNDKEAKEIKKIQIVINNNKNAYYDPKSNRLSIFEDGLPVYLNDNGMICKDPVALEDSL